MEDGFAGLPHDRQPSNLPHRHVDPLEELRAENRRLREHGDKLFNDYVDATMALGLVTGVFPPFNDTVRKRAQDFLVKRKAEWDAKQSGG
jgi:hypothetical protein